MKIRKTSRGFSIGEFTDRYNIKCSIQKSSMADEDCIWLGCQEGNPRVCDPVKGWTPVELPPGYVVMDTRMHLTQDMVKELLPLLHKFAKTGELE